MNDQPRKTVTFEDLERRHIDDHGRAYYPWLRHVVTLALTALTALVALQGHYVPSAPKMPLALAVGWIALALCILSGLYTLRSEYITPLNAVRDIRARRAKYGDAQVGREINENLGHQPPRMHKWAVRLMVSSFIVALVAICTFAIVNLPGLSPHAS
jgi:hypothetical protein